MGPSWGEGAVGLVSKKRKKKKGRKKESARGTDTVQRKKGFDARSNGTKMGRSKSKCLSPSGKGRQGGQYGRRETLVRTRKKSE